MASCYYSKMSLYYYSKHLMLLFQKIIMLLFETLYTTITHHNYNTPTYILFIILIKRREEKNGVMVQLHHTFENFRGVVFENNPTVLYSVLYVFFLVTDSFLYCIFFSYSIKFLYCNLFNYSIFWWFYALYIFMHNYTFLCILYIFIYFYAYLLVIITKSEFFKPKTGENFFKFVQFV